MCGIVGIYAPASFDQREKLIRKMADALSHRGPDDAGYFSDRTIALGHRRLSIIDLETGHQPIFNEDKSKCIIFNGEIFNYMEIRHALMERGHVFSTNSDTETILHAYEEWEEACVNRLRGMFAFAIWDAKNETLFLSRDRFGIKPLFYSHYDGIFTFASEIKALLCDPMFKRSIDREALASYFLFSYIPAPLSIYQHINKLPPGHSLIVKNGQITIRKYWDLEFKPDRRKKESDFIAEYKELLKESVKIRLMSDVPLGAFLSGGIDSGAVVALMSAESRTPVNTFTIGFGGNVGMFDDERKYATLIAERYHTNHREFEVAPNVEGLLGHIVRAFDEPFADDSTIPTYYVSKLAREHVTVALSGLGGDEAFCGYERYLGFHISSLYQKIPKIIRENVIRNAIEAIPESHLFGLNTNHIKRFVRSTQASPAERYLGYVSKIGEKHQKTFFSDGHSDYAEAFASSKRKFLSHFVAENAVDPLNKVFYCDVKTYLPDDILACTDRLSMHHSLEVRVPFLDHKLMEFCATIPPAMKIQRFRKKYLLKKGLSSMLPRQVITHKKQGFVGPMAQWLHTELRAFTLDKLSDRSMRAHGLLNPKTVQTILHEHYSGMESHDTLIWSLLVFQSWFDEYMN